MVRVHFGPPLLKKLTVYNWQLTVMKKKNCQLSTINCPLNPIWGVSSAGRAPALQAGGHRFDPGTLHQTNRQLRDWLKHHENDVSLSLLRDLNAPWKLNIEVIMMQLWEQQLREIYNWVKIQFCKYLLKWVCIILLIIENQIGLFLIGWTEWSGRTNPAEWGQANKSARGMPWH